MNKYIRRSLALLVILTLLLTSFSNVFGAQQLICQTVEKQTITAGVTLESYDRFTTSGWIKAYVLRVDLSNKNVKVVTLTNKTSVVSSSTVLNLAKNSGAIAAVNAAFLITEQTEKVIPTALLFLQAKLNLQLPETVKIPELFHLLISTKRYLHTGTLM
jgi:hypothetical protein